MLLKLNITNYALIDHVEAPFHEGLTVVTGESGAGKSIMLEALGLLLGSRANFSAIRKGEEKCSVEAVFGPVTDKVRDFLEINSLDQLDELILRRELTASGRSRAFVNDTPVNLSVLSELGRLIIDLHGQQENIALQSSNFQCLQLDLFAGNRDLFETYVAAYRNWRATEAKLKELMEASAQVRKDQDYFQFQYDELSSLDFDQEKFEALEKELTGLENAEEILRVLNAVSQALSDEDRGAISATRFSVNEIKQVAQLSPHLGEIAERLKSLQLELEDLAAEVERSSGAVEMNPDRLAIVQETLNDYNRLIHKHGAANLQELEQVKKDYELKLGSIESFDEELERLEKQRALRHEEVTQLAKELSRKRTAGVSEFETRVSQSVSSLGMPKAQFKVVIEKLSEPGSLGIDRVQMMFDANGSSHLQPMDQVASGGEMARLMLALKSVQPNLSEGITLIFDEIDTGVSGEVAKRIGALMHDLGKKTQIIAVTHLPGVAAKGDHHLKIYKEETDQISVSKLRYLSHEDRVVELAAMFTGETKTEASLQSARSLLESNS